MMWPRCEGTRFVSAMEIESGQRLAESLVKQLTGGDKISARFLHSEFFEFHPQFKIWIGANHKPIIRGTDLAIWRRIRLIPFPVQIPPEKQDKALTQKLKEELPGILNWAVQGCLRWQAEGLNPPKEVKSATESYREEMDFLLEFIREKCLIDRLVKVRIKELYQSYVTWAIESGEKRPITQREFSRRIEEKGFSKRPGAGNAYFFYGMGLLEVK